MPIDPHAVMRNLGLRAEREAVESSDDDRLVAFTPKPHYVLGELLGYSGHEFVDVAYLAVLKRRPDEAGRRSYLDALAAGTMSKVEVLGHLRWSGEGLEKGVHVDGLLLPYTYRRWARRRWIGRPLRWLATLARIDVIQPRMEAQETLLALRDERLERRAGSAIGQVRDALQQELEGTTRALRDSLMRSEEQAARRIGELQSRLDAIESRFEVRMLRGQGDQEGTRACQSPPTEGATPDELSAMYVRLEEVFRGSQEEIRRRGQVYLPYIAEAAAASGSRATLDLGCGRGELLQLLADNGYQARGIDLNPMFIEENRNAGRDVALLDALSALRRAEPGSLAAITSIHLVEHLPVDVLVRLLDLAFVALRPGGKLILETPNPQNLRTSAYYFYFDPTHRNPIPPPLLQWMAGDRGFVDVRVDLLEDGRFAPEFERVPQEQAQAALLNAFVDWLAASPDYAIIATKPH